MVNSICRYLVPVLFVVSIHAAFVVFCGILQQYCGCCWVTSQLADGPTCRRQLAYV